MSNCTRCALHGYCATVQIPYEGDPRTARILLLGDAPGEVEDKVGKPMQGRSGRLLRQCLEAIGLLPEVVIDTVVRCRPPGNRAPEGVEVVACDAHTEALIKNMPNLQFVIPMGSPALKAIGVGGAVLKKAGVPVSTNLHGKDVTVIPVAHPDYVFHNLPYAGTWEEHWKLIASMLKSQGGADLLTSTGSVIWKDGIKEGQDISLLLQITEGTFSLDLETTHLDPKHASIQSFAVSKPGVGTLAVEITNPLTLEMLRRIVSQPDAEIIMHHSPFDSLILDKLLGTRVHRVTDTELIAARVNPYLPRNLGAVVAREAPEAAGFKGETERLLAQGLPFWRLPAEARLRRNALDAWSLHSVRDRLVAGLPGASLPFLAEDAALACFVSRMEARGLWLDEQVLQEIRVEAETLMSDAQGQLKTMLGWDCNPGSSPQTIKALEELGVRVPCHPKTHQPTTGEKEMQQMVVDGVLTDRQVRAVQSILSYREGAKVQGTYVSGYAKRRDGDGFLRTHFRYPGTVSWRLASTNPNLQNVPRGRFRRAFKAPPGMKLIEVDYEQAEFRVAAIRSQDPAMLAAIRAGDPHGMLAERMFGHGFTKDQRHRAKTTNFLLIFEGGIEVLMREFAKGGTHLSWMEAEDYHTAFWNLYAMLKTYWLTCEAQARAGEPLFSQVAGLHWTLKDAMLAHNGLEQEALQSIKNATIQSVPPRLALRAALRAEKDGVLCVLNTHDGNLAYADEKDAIEAGLLLKKHMEDVAQEEPSIAGYRFPASLKVGDDWYSAEEVTNQGRLPL